jgi:hypothetical protein
VIEDRVRLQLRLDDLVVAIDDAERRGQRLRVQALLIEYEMVTGEMADRPARSCAGGTSMTTLNVTAIPPARCFSCGSLMVDSRSMP